MCRICRKQPPPHALQRIPRRRPLRGLRCLGSWLQVNRLHSPEKARDALDGRRGERIISLRCCVLSGRYEDYWAYRSAPTEPAVSNVSEN